MGSLRNTCGRRKVLKYTCEIILDRMKYSACILIFIIYLSSLIPSTNASAQAGSSHRHRLHHGDAKRHLREIETPVYQSYVSDSRVTDGYSVVPLKNEEKSMHQNLHKPDFVDCSNYRPSIPEGQPIGTSVMQVTAIDNDPPEAGGTVIYSIVSVNENYAAFAIDENTGWITTKKMFDRDEPAKEKEVYVTVRASDNGNPGLDAVCTMKVQITDINDNTAQFLLSRRFQQGAPVPEHHYNPNLDKYEYRESMPQDLAIGQVVMRISATDIDDGNNGTVVYRIEPHPNRPSDIEYFEISSSSGEIKLKKKIMQGQSDFQLRIVASDLGVPPLKALTDLSIVVAEPLQRPPEFINPPFERDINEFNYNLSIPVATLSARSNADDDYVFFELVNGQTQPTNKDAIFTIENEGKNTHIKIDRQLDYESVTKYTLTIRAINKYNLAAEILLTVLVNDQNDEKPYFTEVTTGTVLENEPPGTSVMRVRAIDTDGTSPNNEVTYQLEKDDDSDNFRIDSVTGEITTKKSFDREEKDFYKVIVNAYDGSPSVVTNNGKPNKRPQVLKMVIADKNDNVPVFDKDLYEAEMSEDADLKSDNVVVEVRAKDKDTASVIQYFITEGNIGDAFDIKSYSTGGRINVKNQLDYETIRKYELTVKASDSLNDVYTKVRITIQNINDRPPEFEPINTSTTIVEESVPSECIFRVKAYDPDIGDRTLPQNISFFIDTGKEYFDIGAEDGCVKVIKPLDREANSFQQIRVGAYDELGLAATKLTSYLDLRVDLIDINDNAPKLASDEPVVWMENRPRGPITVLEATDADTPDNGPPFSFAIDYGKADPEIRNYFSIKAGKTLMAEKDNFDREEKKEYIIPIAITDSGADRKTGISYLRVIIGDENDNRMKDGESKIFVYKYKSKIAFPIGRVYVEDLDDWDLPDKTFEFSDHSYQFTVDSDTGDINMRPTTEAGLYNLTFLVTDNKFNDKVTAKVYVTVKQITDEAVDSSGSIRFVSGTKEQFIKPDKTGLSKKDKLQNELSTIFGVPLENVDVFTVGNSPENPDSNTFDVRYSVHNSPYWKPERLNGILAEKKEMLERYLDLKIVMVGIDECLKEKPLCDSCTNHLDKSEIPARIFTNTTSFVGVHAFVNHSCECASSLVPTNCSPNPCFNKGICTSGGGFEGFKCECTESFSGPRCEVTSISMDGQGYAWYPSLTVCNDSQLQIQFMTVSKNGLIFYNGPISNSALDITDFMSLELKDGKPILLTDYGTGISRIEMTNSPNLGDGLSHKISVSWSPKTIALRIDECRKNEFSCYQTARPMGSRTQLNVNGPLQLGGISFNPSSLQKSMRWATVPTKTHFIGCIANLTFNGQHYDLGNPSYSTVNVTSCDSPSPIAITSLGVDFNFIIILLVCILILLLLIIGIVFYRRRRSYEEVKGELGDDVRENIINYSDEGGGEGDQTGYDLSVLMKPANGPSYISSPTDKIPLDTMHPHGRIPDNGDNPDIQSFLQGNKNKVDNDPDGLPYDDVRNYAYEGDGNSMGSLSSLASGTDDGDLNFDYLPTFGPRFKKLADMYGGQSSDDESYTGAPPEAWC